MIKKKDSKRHQNFFVDIIFNTKLTHFPSILQRKPISKTRIQFPSNKEMKIKGENSMSRIHDTELLKNI